MANRLLLLACDPGGANIIGVLVAPLAEAGFSIELYGVGNALSIFEKENLVAGDLTRELSPTRPLFDELQKFLSLVRPNLVLTGTSGNDFHERLLGSAANLSGIPSVAVLDQWINYGLRFSSFGLRDVSLYQEERQHPYLPETICVMDELARREMVEEGIPAERIVVTGHPYLERIQSRKPALSVKEARYELGIPEENLVMVFASEPLSQAYPTSNPLGYTEKTIFQEILICLETIDRSMLQDLTLIIKPHPKESCHDYESILAEKSFHRIRPRIECGAAANQLLYCADCVIGMASSLLLEAALWSIPVVSVQIGGIGRNPFVLCRAGVVQAVKSREVLSQTLERLLLKRAVTGTTYRISEAATANLVQLIREKTGFNSNARDTN